MNVSLFSKKRSLFLTRNERHKHARFFFLLLKGRTENWDHVKNVDVIQELRSGTVSQGHIVSGDCVCDDYISRATVQTLDLLSQENPFYMFKSRTYLSQCVNTYWCWSYLSRCSHCALQLSWVGWHYRPPSVLTLILTGCGVFMLMSCLPSDPPTVQSTPCTNPERKPDWS